MQQKSTIGILVIAIIVIGSVVFFTIVNESNETVNKKTYKVNDEHDNGRTFTVENSELGYGNENGSRVLLQLSSSYSFGVKFDDIDIHQGAIIKTAYIELFSVGTPFNRYPNCKIYCDDTDNAVNFYEIGVLDICGRKYTDNYTGWNSTVEYDKWEKTPSLVKPIQEIVNRNNWKSGNKIAFLFVSEGVPGYRATFQNFENGYPAKLYVEWT